MAQNSQWIAVGEKASSASCKRERRDSSPAIPLSAQTIIFGPLKCVLRKLFDPRKKSCMGPCEPVLQEVM
jgi:hypothetical protein